MKKKDYILIVTANENETSALLNDQNFCYSENQRSDIPYDMSFYNIGKYGCYNVVHFELNTEGTVGSDAAQLSIATAIDAFNPKAVILVGIAFGKEFSDNKNKKQKIGDVLVSKTVADYESGKIKDTKIQSDGFIAESGRGLFSVFKNYSKSWKYKLDNGFASCEFGLILSGDKVVDDKSFKELLIQRFPRAIGGEMEGRGAYSACRNRGVSEWIIVKAICDWADGTKAQNKKENQIIASKAAVSLLNCVFTQKDSLVKIVTPEIDSCVKIDNEKIPTDIMTEVETIQEMYLDKIFHNIESNESKFNEAKKMIEKFTIFNGEQIQFSELINMILSCNDKLILRINGLRGTGKSTLFTLIYHELKCSVNSTNLFPVLIDLRILFQKHQKSSKKALDEQLDKIDKLINTHPDRRFFIMFDGLNEYELGSSGLEETVNKYISGNVDKGKNFQNFAFCVGNTENMPEEQGHINILHSLSIQSKYQVDVSRINSVAYSKLDEILKQLIYIYSFDLDESLVSTIKKTIDDYTVNHVDYRTLLILLRVFVWKRSYNKEWHLGNCFFDYYLYQLNGKEKELYKCAKTAYNHVVLHVMLGSSKYREVIYNNGITTDFFLALHFVKTMRSPQNNVSEILGRGFVFTALVNKFIKDLLNIKFKAEQTIIVNNMIKSYPWLDDSMKSQICYILGRVQDSNAKIIAKKFLLDQWEDIYQRLFENNILKVHNDILNSLILFRTISVSLILIGCDTKLDDFLQCILYNEKLNQINRGFHLEYYEDKSYLNGVSPTYLDDKSIPADKTMGFLIDSISKKISSKTALNKSIYLDIITLFSIYQYRFDDESFVNKYRDKLKEVIKAISYSSKIQSKTITNYIKTINELFEIQNPLNYILTELNATKSKKRQGWVDRNVNFPESIADHMYGCYLIGTFLLPNNISQCVDYKIPDIEKYSEYSKDKILQILLLHDLAEAKEGDIVTQKKNKSDMKKENIRFDYYQYLCSFPKIYGLGTKKELWEEFSSNSTINAKIANDLDKIEPVIQAFFYRIDGNKIDLNEWIEYAKKHISTSLILQLLQYLEDNLFNTKN